MKAKTVSVPAEVADVLRSATDKVLKAMGGKWNRKAGGHKFAFDPSTLLADALGTGKAVNRQQTLQFFETPADLAQKLVVLAGVNPGGMVLEPSAGHGRLVKPALERGADVVAVELDPTNADVLSRIGGVEVHQADFLEWAKYEKRRFDAAVMNPPFSGNQDIRHIKAAWNLLRDGGRIAAILSAHAFIGQERECVQFRDWLTDIDADFEQVPAGTFGESGTQVSAWLVSATKAAGPASANVLSSSLVEA